MCHDFNFKLNTTTTKYQFSKNILFMPFKWWHLKWWNICSAYLKRRCCWRWHCWAKYCFALGKVKIKKHYAPNVSAWQTHTNTHIFHIQTHSTDDLIDMYIWIDLSLYLCSDTEMNFNLDTAARNEHWYWYKTNRFN